MTRRKDYDLAVGRRARDRSGSPPGGWTSAALPRRRGYSASLLPYEIVREKPMQVIKSGSSWHAGCKTMQFAAERASLSLTFGVAHETDVMIDGSPPVGAFPDQLATGFAASLDFLEAQLFRGQ